MGNGPLKVELESLKIELEKLLQNLQNLDSVRRINTQDQGKYIVKLRQKPKLKL